MWFSLLACLSSFPHELTLFYFILFFGFYVLIYLYGRSSFFVYILLSRTAWEAFRHGFYFILFVLTFVLTMYFLHVIRSSPYSLDPHLLGLASTPGDT